MDVKVTIDSLIAKDFSYTKTVHSNYYEWEKVQCAKRQNKYRPLNKREVFDFGCSVSVLRHTLRIAHGHWLVQPEKCIMFVMI